ncbi:MAG: TolC family protein [Phycisphaeraceae bacterium]
MQKLLFILILCLASLAGCTPSPLSDSWLPPRALGRDIGTFKPPRLSEMNVPAEEAIAANQPRTLVEPTGELRLGDALTLALLHNPDLATVAYDVRASEARRIQAGLPPNPSIGIMLNQFGGQDELRGFRGAETSLRFSQLIETAGKLTRRVELARADQRLAAWDYETKRLALFAQATQRFVEVLAAQERVALARESLTLAEQTLTIIDDRVKQGVAAPVDRDKAKVRFSTERIALARAGRSLASSKHQLAATWGSASPKFASVIGDLTPSPALPSLESLASAAGDHPDIARWDDEITQRRAALALARAKRIPDVTASAGVMRMNDVDETVFLAELMIPLPLFDRNQGGILEAVYSLGKAKQQQAAAKATLQAALARAYHEVAASQEEAAILRDETLPSSKASLDASQDAFRNGKVTYLDVLDAQRTYVEVKTQLVDAQAAAHSGAAMIEGLTGRALK